jgi:hypothetical protein
MAEVKEFYCCAFFQGYGSHFQKLSKKSGTGGKIIEAFE